MVSLSNNYSHVGITGLAQQTGSQPFEHLKGRHDCRRKPIIMGIRWGYFMGDESIYIYTYIYVKQPTNNKTVTWISLVHESGALAMANSRLLLPKIT